MTHVKQTLYNQYLKAAASMLSGAEVTLAKTDGTDVTLTVNKIAVSNALLYTSKIEFDPDRATPPSGSLAEVTPSNPVLVAVGTYRLDYVVTPSEEATVYSMLVKAVVNDQHEILFAHVDFITPVSLIPNASTVIRFAHVLTPTLIFLPLIEAIEEVVTSATVSLPKLIEATSLNDVTPAVEYSVTLE